MLDFRTFVVLSLLLGSFGLFAAGCGSCLPPVVEADAGPETGDAGVDDDCTTLTFGPITLDVVQDVRTIYSAEIEPGIGSGVPDYLVLTFVNTNERFGPLGVGTFSLEDPPNDNRNQCPECILVFEDQLTLTSPPERVFFQREGSITLDENPRGGRLKGSITDLVLEEVTIDNGDLTSTPVENGDCFRIETFSFDVKSVPAEWTCDEALFQDGQCNCDCGATDPDCFCDPFRNPDCPAVIEDDCPAGTTCTPDGCLIDCDPFASPTVGCAFGELCGFSFDGPQCIDDENRTNPAQLGETCAGLGIFVEYCAIENTVPAGVCDDIDSVCKPICGPSNPCPDNEDCYTIAGGGPETGYGFCPGNAPGDVPAEWTCDPDSWGDVFTCDCECGAPDPDCESGENFVAGCDAGETCVEDVCTPM